MSSRILSSDRPDSVTSYSTRRAPGVDVPHDDAIHLRFTKRERDHAVRHVEREARELTEALSPVEQMAHEYRFPPTADDTQRRPPTADLLDEGTLISTVNDRAAP